MTRQPSTRTAEVSDRLREPRTAAGRLLDWLEQMDRMAETRPIVEVSAALWKHELRPLIWAARAEAAASAGLNVEALALVFAGITFSEWADAQGDTTRLFDLTRHVAAEYARRLEAEE